MANPDHLAVLNSGVASWNQWRQAHPDIVPDLSHASLQGMDLQQANLTGANCRGANFADANLANADLSQAQLQDAILKWKDSRGTVFAGTTFTQSPTLSLHLVTSLVARGAIACPPTAG